MLAIVDGFLWLVKRGVLAFLVAATVYFSVGFTSMNPGSDFLKITGVTFGYHAEGKIESWAGIESQDQHTLFPPPGIEIANLSRARRIPGRPLLDSPVWRAFAREYVTARDRATTRAELAAALFAAFLVSLYSWHAVRARNAKRRVLASKTREHKIIAPKNPQLQICGVPLPRNLEPRGLMLSGSPGSGKSQIISSLLQQVRARGEPGVVIDRGTEAMPIFYQRQDVIFNPLDSRGVIWSPLSECRSELETDTLAEALWPQSENPAANYFQHCARQIYGDVVSSGKAKTNGELWDVLSNQQRLHDAIRGTPSQTLGEAKNFGDMFSSLLQAIPWLRYLPRGAGAETKSISELVRSALQNHGMIWVTIPKQFSSSLNPLASLVMGQLFLSAVALPPDQNRRLWAVSDELGNLPKISRLDEAVSEGRKHGLAVISAMQSLAQLREKYGQQGAQVLMSCYSSWWIGRAGDAETGEAMSRHVGDTEIREWRRTSGESHGEHSSTSSGQSEQIRVKKTARARELMEQPDGTGWLCLSHFPPVQVRVSFKDYGGGNAPGFIPRKFQNTQPPAQPGAAPSPSPISAPNQPGAAKAATAQNILNLGDLK